METTHNYEQQPQPSQEAAEQRPDFIPAPEGHGSALFNLKAKAISETMVLNPKYFFIEFDRFIGETARSIMEGELIVPEGYERRPQAYVESQIQRWLGSEVSPAQSVIDEQRSIIQAQGDELKQLRTIAYPAVSTSSSRTPTHERYVMSEDPDFIRAQAGVETVSTDGQFVEIIKNETWFDRQMKLAKETLYRIMKQEPPRSREVAVMSRESESADAN